MSYPYDVDPSFATGGRLSFDFLGNSLVDAICSVIPLSSGKILLVGTAKTVTISGLSLGGADAPNYALTQPTTTASITRLPISGSFTASDKVYDCDTSATIARKIGVTSPPGWPPPG